MLYIFDPDEKLIAILKPDFTRSTGPATTSRAFLSAAFPAEFDREPTAGCSYWDAVHREVLNGENTFTFTVPADQVDAAYVQDSNLVAFKDLDAYWQFFEIKRLVDLHGDGLTRTAFCEHIFYELIDDIVTDKRPFGSAIAALDGMLENTRWQVGIVDDLGAASTNAYYESVLSAVQKVAEAWQGELHWRCVISGGVITRYVDLRAMVGTDTGKQFAYSKDILSIEREEDISGIATALYGRGKGIELDSGAYGRRLTFADVVAADKPAGQEWIGDDEALARWGRPGGRHRFDVFTDEEETDPEVLLEKTRAELIRRKVPRVTYRLDVVSLEQLTGYEHEQVRKGDLVRVIDREFTPELVVSARVIDIERDLLDPANTKVVLGSFAPTIVEATINTARRVEEMANRPYNTKWLDGVINVLQNAIENTQAYIFETPQGTLHMNAPTYEQATEAMLLGGGRYAIANQKDGQGSWNWRTFGDGSGFTADAMTTGVLNAALVSIISAGGNFTIDGTGAKVYDANDVLRIHIGEYAPDEFGAKIIGGKIYSSEFRTGIEGAKTYIVLKPAPTNAIEMWTDVNGTSKKQFEICSTEGYSGATIHFLQDNNSGVILGFDADQKFIITNLYTSSSGERENHISADKTTIGGELYGSNPWKNTSVIRGNAVFPLSDVAGPCGDSYNRWTLVRGVNIQSGDICFDERECAICGQPFADGDILCLLVRTVHDNYCTMTIPIHDRCKGVQKSLNIKLPKMVTKYRLNEQGEKETYTEMAIESVEKEVVTIHPDYEMDELTGKFKRKLSEYNLTLFSEGELNQRVFASDKVAKVTDVIKSNQIEYVDHVISVGGPLE